MDIDAGVNGLVEYFLVEGTNNQTAATTTSKDGRKIALADGFGTFEIAYPHQGHVSLNDDRRFDLSISLLSLFLFHPVRFLGHHCKDTGLRASPTLLPHHCCVGELLSTLILLSVRVYVREAQEKKSIWFGSGDTREESTNCFHVRNEKEPRQRDDGARE